MIAFLEARHAGLMGKGHFVNNLVAGLVVGVVALPLAMAFAIASGAKPEQGIYTAIVAGFLTSAFGGSRLQIAGPTGAFIVILSGITAKYGIAGLQVATLMAGVILIAMGLARFGAVIKFIPAPVIVGFTTGIGVIIWVGQWKDFFGLHPAASGEHFHQKLGQLLLSLPQLHWTTTLLALLALALNLFSPKVFKRIPGPLVAMVVVTAIQSIFQFDGVATIGSAFGGIPRELPAFDIPDFSSSDLVKLIGPAFTIALLGAIESLLSAVVADGMAGTKHDPNQELVGQGIANVAAPLFGGFAATGAIARTATNIRNGASSPLAGMVHAATLLMIILVAAPLASYIPLCALSAILFVVAWNMSELHHFLHLLRTSPKGDMGILLITFGLTVFADLVLAVNVGVVLASLLFMQRMAQSVEVQDETDSHLDEGLIADSDDAKAPARTLIYSIDGPFFFGAAEKLQSTLASIQEKVDTVVLRMGRVPFVDATGIQALSELINDFQRGKATVVLCEIRPNVQRKLERGGIVTKVGESNVYPRLADWKATRSN
ncbi:MAG TPA: sulfate permease [Rhodocyclaceae bacterium]|jgi:SulP family sulfate permease